MDTISSRANGDVRLLRQLFREKKLRSERNLFAVEGDHLCKELAVSGHKTDLFAYTRRAEEKYPAAVKKMLEVSAKAVVITEDISEYISDTKTPQGLYAAAELRKWELPRNANSIIVMDGVQDPGNVGTIMRTAEAFGFDGAVLLGACADVYSPKTLRASMGSALRFPFACCAAEDLRSVLDGFTVYAAMLDSSAAALGEIAFAERSAVIIGSEGRGVSPEAAAFCDEKLYIPIGGAESLNAAIAAAVIMWEIARR